MFAKPPFTYFEITLFQIHFAKTTLGFSVITKIPFYLHFKFSKASHKHTQLYTNQHILHTNKLCLAYKYMNCHSLPP
jgi:hypothetical protein